MTSNILWVVILLPRIPFKEYFVFISVDVLRGLIFRPEGLKHFKNHGAENERIEGNLNKILKYSILHMIE